STPCQFPGSRRSPPLPGSSRAQPTRPLRPAPAIVCSREAEVASCVDAHVGHRLVTDQLVRVTCTHDCPDACSALVTVDGDGRAVEITADRSHPITGRHLCVKVDRYLERV